MTGEVSIHGNVKPVGGVLAKVEAAFQAGRPDGHIPKENWQDMFAGRRAERLRWTRRRSAEASRAPGLEAGADLGHRSAAAAGTAPSVRRARKVSYLQADSAEWRKIAFSTAGTAALAVTTVRQNACANSDQFGGA